MTMTNIWSKICIGLTKMIKRIFGSWRKTDSHRNNRIICNFHSIEFRPQLPVRVDQVRTQPKATNNNTNSDTSNIPTDIRTPGLVAGGACSTGSEEATHTLWRDLSMMGMTRAWFLFFDIVVEAHSGAGMTITGETKTGMKKAQHHRKTSWARISSFLCVYSLNYVCLGCWSCVLWVD